MCVILVKPPGIELKKDLVKELWASNSDGAGYLYHDKKEGGWKFQKGIMLLDKLLDNDSIFNPDNEVVLHLRIKTKGDICKEHTHPFDWSFGSAENTRLLFHNGTVKLLNPIPGESDSSFLAKILKNVSTNEAHELLARFSKEGYGRFVTFVNNKVTTFPDNESVTDSGIWFSNGRHLKKNVMNYSTGNSYTPSLTYPKKTNTVIKTTTIISSGPRKDIIEKLAKHYAKIEGKPYNENYVSEFMEFNGIEHLPSNFLEAACKLADVNVTLEDPLFEMIATFKE